MRAQTQSSKVLLKQEAITKYYKLLSYEDIDVEEQKTLRINSPPIEFSTVIVAKQTTTFGKYLSVDLPSYVDLEGDPIKMSFKDESNPFWNIFPVFQSSSTVFPWTINKYTMQSDVIVEGYNVAKTGSYTIRVTWTDSSTGLSAPSLLVSVDVLSADDYKVYLVK